MKELPISDEPVANPDNDLLGARVRAQTLAKHVIDIPAPFTIGIYGQWGEGKTSFVNLFEDYLTVEAKQRGLKEIKFIRFNAWGHATSDAVWRALILKIAEELYDPPKKPETSGSAADLPLEKTDQESLTSQGAALPTVAVELDQPSADLSNGRPKPSPESNEPESNRANYQTSLPAASTRKRWTAAMLKFLSPVASALRQLRPPKADAGTGQPSLPAVEGGEVASPTARKGWPTRVLEFLNEEYVLREPPPEPDPLQDYKDVRARFDRTASTSVGKDSGHQSQLNQEVALLALVKVAVSAMGVLSPLLAMARDFFHIGEPVKLSDLLQKEKSEAARETILSVQEFKKEFHKLFEKKAKPYYQIFVFVDDLDRCMPDVALDVLEAIKIFLGDEKCMFVVAADEELIGEGLRLRLKDILASDRDQESKVYIKQKGKEYFEKIIQLRVRVPQRGPTAAHRYVAAQFPMWATATDIIQIAAGTNPRRLKQHCHQLSYQQMVAQTETEDRRDGSASAAG